MKEVRVSRQIDAPRSAIEAALSPSDIVEYAGTYHVVAVEELDDSVEVTAVAPDLKTVYEFTQVDSEYVYRQRQNEGPFGEMYTRISLSGHGPTEVTIRSCFTIGGRFARLIDWLAARHRKTELRRLLTGIESAVRDD